MEFDWSQGVNANRLGEGVNTIMIKCVLFLQKGLNAENIAVECDIASLNYVLFTQSNRLTIQEDNLYLHATHHAPSIVFLGVNWIKFIWKLMWERGERRSKFGLNGHGTEMESRAQGSRPRTQKISEAKGSPFEDRPFLGQGHRRKCSPKNNNNKVFKNFFHAF